MSIPTYLSFLLPSLYVIISAGSLKKVEVAALCEGLSSKNVSCYKSVHEIEVSKSPNEQAGEVLTFVWDILHEWEGNLPMFLTW